MSLPSLFDYLPRYAVSLCKLAEEKKPEHPLAHGAKTIGKGLLGFGVGSLAGAGAGMLADKAYHSSTGQHIPPSMLGSAAPFVGGAAGLAYALYKHKEREELLRGQQSDVAQGSLPSK